MALNIGEDGVVLLYCKLCWVKKDGGGRVALGGSGAGRLWGSELVEILTTGEDGVGGGCCCGV